MNKNTFIYTFVIIFLFCNICSAEPNFTYSTPNNYKFKTGENLKNNAGEKILFIVDFSNSMNERLGNKTKIDIALSTMKEILQMIPPQTYVGMRVYGHKTGFTPKQSCTASQLVSPIQQNNAINIYSRLSSINAVGWTPITYSLKQAAFFDFADTK